MDDLGNRTTVNLRSGADQVYDTDTPNITNRYTAVGGDPLDYDAAGNLTQDHDGYRYVYDYENRITRIYKLNGQTEVDVAFYAYDALGRRIGKFDAAALEVTYYYYNDQWQILAEYDGTAFGNRYVYGNYIDEVLVMNDGTDDHYYLHDHLYSPAALLDDTGADVERYEYDAYGSVRILNSEFSILNSSQYGNPHAFTGRQLDILDSGTLHHMHYRHRDYSPQLGRFMQQDPFGVNPAGRTENPFFAHLQYTDGVNIYEYGKSGPVLHADSLGLFAMVPPYIPPRDGRDEWYPGKPTPGDRCCKKREAAWKRAGFSSLDQCVIHIAIGDRYLDTYVVGILCGGAGYYVPKVGAIVCLGGLTITGATAYAFCGANTCVEWGRIDECGECK